jgi:hypothetical protein
MQSLEGEGKKDYAVVVHKGAVVAHEIHCALVHMQVIADEHFAFGVDSSKSNTHYFGVGTS